eukprot:IDg9797t1
MSRMTTDVLEMAWEMLQPRNEQPPPVLGSVPPGDLQKVLVDMRKKRSEIVLAAHVLGRNKRKHPSAVDEEDTGSSEGERARRSRRSTRPRTRQGSGSASPDEELGKSRGNEPKVGTSYQAEVPAGTIPESKRTPDMTRCDSILVYSIDQSGGIETIQAFLKKLSVTLVLRDGYGCSPNTEEIALRLLTKNKGNVDAALQKTCKEVTGGSNFPGVGKRWSYEEKCLFVRAMAERSMDFGYIARHVLKRPTSEVVNMYYTYQKQQNLQHGMRANGYIFDTGEELTEFLPRLGPERISLALRCLAMTAGDGFPADRRMAQAVKMARDNSGFDERRRRSR